MRMIDKKSANRFTIQFNSRDSTHQQVIEILNLQGRKKAQYIVNAILSYESQSESENNSFSAEQLSHYKIKAVVEQILASRNMDTAQSKQIKASSELTPKREFLKTASPNISATEMEITDDDFDMISGMIDDFHKV